MEQEKEQLSSLLSSTRDDLEQVKDEMQFSLGGTTVVNSTSSSSFGDHKFLLDSSAFSERKIDKYGRIQIASETPKSSFARSTTSSLDDQECSPRKRAAENLRTIKEHWSELPRTLFNDAAEPVQQQQQKQFDEWILDHTTSARHSRPTLGRLSVWQEADENSQELTLSPTLVLFQDLYLLQLHLDSSSDLASINRPLQRPFDMEYLTEFSNSLIDELKAKATEYFRHYLVIKGISSSSKDALLHDASGNSLPFDNSPPIHNNSDSQIQAPHICWIHFSVLLFHHLADARKMVNDLSLAFWKSRQDHSHSVLKKTTTEAKSGKVMAPAVRSSLSFIAPSASSYNLFSSTSSIWKPLRTTFSFSKK
jgi:hypothetical protein